MCPCCKNTSPVLFGITKCNNLRVLKHRILNDRKTPVVVRNNPKIYTAVRVSQDCDYETAYTLMCMKTEDAYVSARPAGGVISP